MNSYEQRANDFLLKTNSKIETVFLKNDFHFQNDKTKRDIYKVTITRGRRSFSFEFGQSIFDSQYYQDKNIKERTYTLNGEMRTGNFKILDISKYSPFITLVKGKIPTNYSILACLQKYDVGTFRDFCWEFEYSEDSKKAEKIYIDICKEYDDVCKIWSDSEIELLKEII